MPDTTLAPRLRAYLQHPATRQLLRVAPAAVVVGLTGAILAAVGVHPDFAQTGVGIIASGIAMNLASKTLEPILDAVDDESRDSALQHALESGDRDAQLLASSALIHAGPALAEVLPAPTLAQQLAEGMQAYGGPLALIAPAFRAGLETAGTDWSALQKELRSQLASITMTMEASEKGVIRQSTQEAEQTGGPINMSMRATREGLIEGSSQTVMGKNTRR